MGPGGVLELDAAANALLERLLQTPGVMVARADLLALLYSACPQTRSTQALLMRCAKQARVVVSVLTGGAVRLQMRGRDLFAVTRNRSAWRALR